MLLDLFPTLVWGSHFVVKAVESLDHKLETYAWLLLNLEMEIFNQPRSKLLPTLMIKVTDMTVCVYSLCLLTLRAF